MQENNLCCFCNGNANNLIDIVAGNDTVLNISLKRGEQTISPKNLTDLKVKLITEDLYRREQELETEIDTLTIRAKVDGTIIYPNTKLGVEVTFKENGKNRRAYLTAINVLLACKTEYTEAIAQEGNSKDIVMKITPSMNSFSGADEENIKSLIEDTIGKVAKPSLKIEYRQMSAGSSCKIKVNDNMFNSINCYVNGVDWLYLPTYSEVLNYLDDKGMSDDDFFLFSFKFILVPYSEASADVFLYEVAETNEGRVNRRKITIKGSTLYTIYGMINPFQEDVSYTVSEECDFRSLIELYNRW